MKRDINLLRKENNFFRNVFEDLLVDRELVYYENRSVIPIDMKQAALNSIHSGNSGREYQFFAGGKTEQVTLSKRGNPYINDGTKIKNPEKRKTVRAGRDRKKNSRGDRADVCRP